MNNSTNSLIKIYNFSEFILRCSGTYFFDQSIELFTTPTIYPQHLLEINIPPNIVRVECFVELWNITQARWESFFHIAKTLPGNYCFKVTGTILNSSCVEIPCP